MSSWTWQVWLLVGFLALVVLYPKYRMAIMISFALLFFFLDSPWMQAYRGIARCQPQLKNGELVGLIMNKPVICQANDTKLEHCRPCREDTP
jgi:hypothetical protein